MNVLHPVLRARSGQALLSIVLTIGAGTTVFAADAPLSDVPGGHDSPYISRFAGSTLVGYEERAFDEAQFPLTNQVEDRRFVKAQTVEGKVTRIAYLAPAGKTRLEVQRNFQEALNKAGFVKKFACDADGCGRGTRIQEPFIPYAQTMNQVRSYGGYSDLAFLVLNTEEPHYIWGTLKSQGRDVTLSIYLSVLTATEDSPLNKRVGVFIETVEPKAMEGGQVTIDANALQKGLAAEGKIALYGIYFDTGKADIKPESKPQLEQMAKLLEADKSLKVFIVGHTDNQGAVDANVTLSQRRADAIVQALVKDYKVDPKRLVAKGVANFAPVASNDAEAGRAKNRRVELVRQ